MIQSPYLFKPLTSDRLILRQLKEKDAQGIFSLRSNPEVNRYLGRTPQTRLEEANAFIEKINNSIKEEKAYFWAITQKGNDELIGSICLWNLSDDRKKGEIGYELLPAYQGKGIMKEAIGILLNFCFSELQMEQIEAWTHKDNLSSGKLLEQYHFSLTGQKDPDNESVIMYTCSNIDPS